VSFSLLAVLVFDFMSSKSSPNRIEFKNCIENRKKKNKQKEEGKRKKKEIGKGKNKTQSQFCIL
jgi:hypothetical protein